MVEKDERIGRFTSSRIVDLTSTGTREMTDEEKAEHKKQFPKSRKRTISDGFGQGALTYIKNKAREKRALRSIENEVWSKEMSWGNFLEPYIFKKLGSDYMLTSDITDTHPTIENWSGSKDVIKFDEGRTVGDIKAPFTLNSYFDFVDANGDIEKFRQIHNSGETYYFQIVSNAIINNCKYGELIAFVPQQIDLIDLRILVDYEEDKRYDWIKYAEDRQLPYLPAQSNVPNLTIIRFEIPQKDIDFITERVLMANELLKTMI